jgi:hypothetical protein
MLKKVEYLYVLLLATSLLTPLKITYAQSPTINPKNPRLFVTRRKFDGSMRSIHNFVVSQPASGRHQHQVQHQHQ